MVHPSRLILIGYWAGEESGPDWPRPEAFVDLDWDAGERELIGDYLARGLVARSYMGYSKCRICGESNGALELSDGVFVWPDGLSHYVTDHGVRLPDRFVAHALGRTEALEQASRDEDWWRSLR